MDGFWICQFVGVEGFGAGVATFIDGHLFGGDSSFLYTGTYSTNGNALTAQVHVKQHTPGIANVMGQSEFDLQITGTLNVSAIDFNGIIPGTSLKLTGHLTKQSDLP